MQLEVIARIRTDFPAKFGIPRQSGLADTKAEIVFERKYGSPDALKGIEEYSHLWLIWGFSEAEGRKWSPTVRPPRLGGNKRVGVFEPFAFPPESCGIVLCGVGEDREERGQRNDPACAGSGSDGRDAHL